MKQLKKFWLLVVANWQTSLCGVAVITVKVLGAAGKIPAAEADMIAGLIGGGGLIAATDGTRTPAQAEIAKTELEVLNEALAVAKAGGNEKLIAMAQAAVDALAVAPVVATPVI